MIGNFTLDQLRVLVTIAEEGSFSAASRKLRRAQSSISQAIATLENIHGVVLFDRSGHRPELTSNGAVLVEQARSVLSSAGRFESMASSSRQGIEAELSIAIDPLVPTQPCIECISDFSEQFPDVVLNFSYEGIGGAEYRLRNGDVSLAFCTFIPNVPRDIVASRLIQIDLVPVVSASHPLASMKGKIPLTDIENFVQLVLSNPTDINGPHYGILSSRKWRFVDINRRLDFLLAGFGWCRMPEPMIASYVRSGELIALNIEDDPNENQPPLTIFAARSRERPLGVAGQWLMESIKNKFA